MISCEIDLGIDWLLEAIWQVSLDPFPALHLNSHSGTRFGEVRFRFLRSGHVVVAGREVLTNRVYTKKRGDQPDLSDPICLRQGATIETVCHGIHRSLASHFKYALVWGKSSKFNPQPQKVGLTHAVQDEDV